MSKRESEEVTNIIKPTRNQLIGVSLAVALGVALGAFVAFQLWEIRAKGRIVTIGVKVWQDETCTQPLTAIDWGEMYPSQSKLVTCWIQNVKTKTVTLEIFTDDYNPSHAQIYLSTSWTIPKNLTLLPQRVTEATIMLSVSPDIETVTDFSYVIIIKATAVND